MQCTGACKGLLGLQSCITDSTFESERKKCKIVLGPRGLHLKGVLTLVRKIRGPALCNSLSAVWAAESHGPGLL